jgi:hypothetical protein
MYASIKILLVSISVLLMAVSAFGGGVLPTADDVVSEAVSAQETADEFMVQSRRLRLGYEYIGGFFRERDRIELLGLAEQGSAKLKGIYQRQERMRARIEAYEGDDWDELYGDSFLWRKVAADAGQSLWLKGQVDYYTAVASAGQEREWIAKIIIEKCILGEGVFGGAGGKILRARAFLLMDDGDGRYRQSARELVESVLGGNVEKDSVYFDAAILKLRLAKEFSAGQLRVVYAELGGSKYRDDFELNLRLAFLGLRAGSSELLEGVIKSRPAAEDFVGDMILSGMAGQLESKSFYEVELAVRVVRRKGLENYKHILGKLCSIEKFRSRSMLITAGEAHEKSEPGAAVQYYLAAAQCKQDDDKGGSRMLEILHRGAVLGIELFYADSGYSSVGGEAVDYYCEAAGENIDEEIQYAYAGMLAESGQGEERVELLGRIAGGKGRFCKRARLDLIKYRLCESGDGAKLKGELEELIYSASGDESDAKVRVEAVELWCLLLLDNGDEESARQVLEILESEAGMERSRGGMLKARALGYLGREAEAVVVLVNTIDPNTCDAAGEGGRALAEVVGRIEEYEGGVEDFDLFLAQCELLAKYCSGCAVNEWKYGAELVFAEILLVGAGEDEGKISIAERVLSRHRGRDDNIEMIRCMARFAGSRGEFGKGARLWERICDGRKPSKGADRDWLWWRGKYYQLWCWSQVPGVAGGQVRHAVEVLENSFSDIPDFWGVRLAKLKKGGWGN